MTSFALVLVCGFLQAQDYDVWISDPFDKNHFFEWDGMMYGPSVDLGDSVSWAVAVGDLSGNGILDVAVANNGACYVYHNDGLGTFTRVSGFGAGLPDATSIALADMDQDGTLDLLLATKVAQSSGENQVFLNDGTGLFIAPNSTFGFNNTRSIAVADLNGDGFADVFEANGSLESNRVWINDQTGVVSDSGQSLGSNTSFSVALGDLDGNGSLDAVVANDGQPNQIWINDGTGIFTAGPTLGASDNSTAVALGDLNGDGSLDVVIGQDGDINGAMTLVYSNDGSGSFTESNQVFPSIRTLSLQVLDINRDGSNDLLLGNIGNDAVWINQNNGQFSPTAITLNAGYSSSVFAGFFRSTRTQAQVNWGHNWHVIDLLKFERQLKAIDEHLRGR